MLITIVSAVVMVVVSYMTAEPDYVRIKSLTYGTVTDEDRTRTRASWSWQDVAGFRFCPDVHYREVICTSEDNMALQVFSLN